MKTRFGSVLAGSLAVALAGPVAAEATEVSSATTERDGSDGRMKVLSSEAS